VFESEAYSLCDTMAFSELTVALNGTKVGALVKGTRTHQLDHCLGACNVCFRRYIYIFKQADGHTNGWAAVVSLNLVLCMHTCSILWHFS